MKFTAKSLILTALATLGIGCSSQPVSVSNNDPFAGGDPFQMAAAQQQQAAPGTSSTHQQQAQMPMSPPGMAQTSWRQQPQPQMYQTHPEQQMMSAPAARQSPPSSGPIRTVAASDDPFAAPTVSAAKVIHADFSRPQQAQTTATIEVIAPASLEQPDFADEPAEFSPPVSAKQPAALPLNVEATSGDPFEAFASEPMPKPTAEKTNSTTGEWWE